MLLSLIVSSVGSIVGGIVGAIIGLIFLLFLLSLVVFFILFARPSSVYKPNAITYKMMGPELDNLNKYNADHLVELKKLSCDTVTVKSTDGLTFSGYFYKCNQETDKIVLLSHGFKSTAYNTYPAIALFYLSQGFDVLMINHRAHEKSEGAWSGFGQLEGADLLQWLDFIVKKNPDYKIVMHGNSMGAASVMEASCMNIPSNVKCIVSDCGFTSSRDELKYQMKEMFHVPPFPILDIVALYCKLFAKFNLDGVSALESVKNAKAPMMFVHGKKDATVPVSMAEELYKACGNEKELALYEESGHGQSYFKYEKEYQEKLMAFVNKYIK